MHAGQTFEGTRWFGLRKTAFMFHPNTELALKKLRGFLIDMHPKQARWVRDFTAAN